MKRDLVLVARCSAGLLAGVVAVFPASAAVAAPEAAGSGRAVEQQTGAMAQEIIVTAQRRAERLQDVPLSVTALTSDMLSRAAITSSRELALVTPGLRIDAGGAYVQPTLRGITTNQTTPSTEPNVATYVDGVYQQTAMAALFALPDAQQVEVLKGPQGTLFGRNATGGAILITTLQPNLQDVSGQLGVSYGRFDNSLFKGYFAVPLVEDRLALGVSAYAEHRDGYKHNLLRGGNREGYVNDYLLRAKLRFIPWDGADFVLTGLYARREDYNGIKNTNYLGNNVAQPTLPASLISSRPWEFSTNVNPFADSIQRSVSLRGTIEVGPGTLTTTTARNFNTATMQSDLDNSPLAISTALIHAKSGSWQQELVYSTRQLGRFRAVAGAFYFHASSGSLPTLFNGAQYIYTSDKSDSYAVFGEATVDFTDQLSLTAGLRYSRDKQSAYAALALNPTPPATMPQLGEETWDAWTPRVSLLYKATQQTNLYATYSEGYRAGVFNTPSFQATPVNPERVKAVEAGVKSNEIRNLSLSAAAFHYKYKDLQQPTLVAQGARIVSELRNAATAKIYGVELNASWSVTEDFDITFGATYLHARFDSFPTAVVNVPNGVGGNVTVPRDVSGNTMIRSPEFSGSLTPHYVKDFAAGTLEASATLYYSTKVYFDVGNRISQGAYEVLNTTLSWQPAGTSLKISAWGKNLTNTAVLYGVNVSNFADGVNYLPPRTYGVELLYRF